ncbi:hypothetical protein [Leptospira idonii]|uniref:Uncharacterized protein n=1 Tax=Leptospira idonii TaxID=1193500 RepID=A0A4R9M3X9_9LEPT|nr:hypothetical protein [Leptospira idonii]TGN20812.1 hypothetical protein EHS15_01885 [Leptospira idonii]
MKIKILEITQSYSPSQKDENGEILIPEIPEESKTLVYENHIYEEILSLDSIVDDQNEVILRKKGKPVPTRWKKMNEEEQFEDYKARRLHAYSNEATKIAQATNKNLVVRIIETP